MRRRSAYTLLEVLLATALAVGLLSALWTLYSTQADLFEKGHERVARAQLCRAITQLIAEDLRCAIQDPVTGQTGTPGAFAAVRRFGLFGTSTELRFDVLQVTPELGYAVPVGRSSNVAQEAQTARVPELRTVYYSLLPAAPADDAEPPNAQHGLMRRELRFETPGDEATSLPEEVLSDLDDLDMTTADTGTDTEELGPFDDSMIWVPEVASIQFRYFDGAGWTTSWDSIQRKSLPVAVEVAIEMAQPTTSVDSETGTGDPLLMESEPGPLAQPEVATSGEYYRVVVDMPSAPAYRKPREMPGPSAPRATARRVAAPRIAPPRFSPQAEPARAADQWIRTGQ